MSYTSKWYSFCPHCQSSLKVDTTAACCNSCGFTYYENPAPCVTAIIERATDNKLVLSQRAVEPNKGKWDFPGGFVMPGESLEESVRREILEEMELDIPKWELLGSAFPDTYGPDGIPTLIFFLYGRIESGDFNVHHEATRVKWFDPHNISVELAFDNDQEAINRYRAYKAAKEHHV